MVEKAVELSRRRCVLTIRFYCCFFLILFLTVHVQLIMLYNVIVTKLVMGDNFWCGHGGWLRL